MTTQEYLQSQWSSLMKSAHADDDKARACFEGLVENYSGQNRYYHTLKHIEALLRQAELVKWRDPVAVKLAIFYHDYIYGNASPEKGSNESQSADEAIFHLATLGFDRNTAMRVAALIRMTETHRADPKQDPDAALFLDIDMGILGARPHVYKVYAWQVWQEYKHLCDASTFCTRRAAFLEKTLKSNDFFLTKKFQDSHGEQARVNMIEELKHLKSGHTPYGMPVTPGTRPTPA